VEAASKAGNSAAAGVGKTPQVSIATAAATLTGRAGNAAHLAQEVGCQVHGRADKEQPAEAGRKLEGGIV